MLPCQNCGHNNELGRIFCHKCGVKLDLTSIKAPSQGGKKFYGKSRWPISRILKWVVDLALLALLGWGIYLLSAVPEPKEMKIPPVAKESIRSKQSQLVGAMNAKQPFEVTVAEVEINALLSGAKPSEATGSGIHVVPITSQVEFGKGVMSSTFIGKFTLGSVEKEIYVRYTTAPKLENGLMDLEPISAAIGEMPIHPWILKNTTVIQGYFKSLFGGLIEECHLEQLHAVVIKDKQATLIYTPPGAAK